MPVQYRYDETVRRLCTRCHGKVRLAEVIAHFRELTTLTKLQPNSDVLLDLTFQTDLPPTEHIDDAARVLEEVSEFLQFGRCAVIAPAGVPIAIAERFQWVSWPLFRGMRIFATNDDATRWLDGKVN
jgi:hypothetical protein